MPYAKCPTCGLVFHLTVRSVESWYADRHPALPVGAVAPEPCFFCWGDLEAGQKVRIRWLSERLAESGKPLVGDTGTVVTVEVSGDRLYGVQGTNAEGEWTRLFERRELQRIRPGAGH